MLIQESFQTFGKQEIVGGGEKEATIPTRASPNQSLKQIYLTEIDRSKLEMVHSTFNQHNTHQRLRNSQAAVKPSHEPDERTTTTDDPGHKNSELNELIENLRYV